MITSVRVSGGLAFQVALDRQEFLALCAEAMDAAADTNVAVFVSVPVESPTGGLTEALIAVGHIVSIQGGVDVSRV